jgi:hypothetical protein
MSDLTAFGLWSRHLFARADEARKHLITRRPLQQVLAFRGRTIDDVVNNPIVKNEIFGYWKLHRQIQRTSEVVDLERQWNAGPRRR